MEKLFEKMGELGIFGIHNLSSLNDNEVFHYYNDFELNVDRTLKLSQLRDLTIFLYKKDNVDEEYINEDMEKYNKYIKELGDVTIKVIFDIGFILENDGYNQENIVKLNSIRVYDNDINKNIPSKLIGFLKECGYGRYSLTDIDYIINSNEKEYGKI